MIEERARRDAPALNPDVEPCFTSIAKSRPPRGQPMLVGIAAAPRHTFPRSTDAVA